MSSQVEISIPTTSTAANPKPHTIYNITLRLPLRSFTLQKRYSDFTALHSNLTTSATLLPPCPLPPKSWLTSTTTSPTLAESRRIGLETYLRAINTSLDPRWRNTSAWRTFLNLPAPHSSSSSNSTRGTLHNNNTSDAQPITDPILWLDVHRELKSQLHSARQQLTSREQEAAASTYTTTTSHSAQAQHEHSALAKKSLVRAGTLISALEHGLKASQDSWSSEKLGEGEVRRRRDLVSAARKEKEGLEGLMVTMAAKGRADAAVRDKQALLEGDAGAGKNGARGTGGRGRPTTTTGRRVLGKETERTRELDNQGVVQLQQEMMREQDEDVLALAKAVRRQRELGVAIQEELEVQNELLGMLGEDVDRVGGKIDVASKRVDKIS
ncbi:hypothetical protein MMC06_001279 [Schaereria dolodes]|nr:hypothetical protein [Schaereria dolodes]